MKTLIRLSCVTLSVLLLVSASTARPVPASSTSDAEFLNFLEDAWVNAIVNRNIPVLERVIADDFNGVSPNGQQYTKREAIADVRSGAYAVESMKLENINVRVLGDIALVTMYQNEKSKFGEENRSGRYIFTDVWAKRNGRWEAVASHGSVVLLP